MKKIIYKVALICLLLVVTFIAAFIFVTLLLKFQNRTIDNKTPIVSPSVTFAPLAEQQATKAAEQKEATKTAVKSVQQQTVKTLSKVENVKASYYDYALKDNTEYSKQNLTTACWSEYPKGTLFRVSYQDKSVIVRCNDRGAFKELGRFLDLSSFAFSQLASLSKGVIVVNVEVVQIIS